MVTPGSKIGPPTHHPTSTERSPEVLETPVGAVKTGIPDGLTFLRECLGADL